MRIRTRASGIEVFAPAKVNLLLEVLARRDDGLHEIETLMCPIDLYDTLYFESQRSPTVDLVATWAAAGGHRGEGALGDLPEGPRNIVVRAIELLRRRAQVGVGARVRLIKRIPSASGLGGGSSDAAAALWAAAQVWGLRWTRSQLAGLAAELGSDVPFFLSGGAAICRGRGERIEPVRGLANLPLVVVRPPDGLSTLEVYRHCQPAAEPRRAEPLVAALRQGSPRRVGSLLYNALQLPAGRLAPWIGRLVQEFQRLSLVGHSMSGSGTAYFGICRHMHGARRAAAQLRARGVGRVFVTRSLARVGATARLPA